jgi:hypothetical protein
MQIVKPDTDDLVSVESERTNVEVLFETFRANKLEKPLHHFVGGMRQLHAQEPGRLQKTPEMVLRPEDEKLLLVIIPIRPDTAEYRGSIV